MKLTEEQQAALKEAHKQEHVSPPLYESDVVSFLAGCAWQREQDAKICESQTALGPVWREMFAAAIRAQGNDRG
jgi:hypothetical protein